MTPATHTLAQLLQDIALQARMKQFVAGDKLVLADATLMAAASGESPLNRSEYAALIASPLTLRRLQTLLRTSQAATAQPTIPAPLFAPSQGILRAAASEPAQLTIATADGFWQVHFLPVEAEPGQGTIAGFHTVLQMEPHAPFADALIDQQHRVEVLDGQSRVLLQGCVNENGELAAAWNQSLTPWQHLQAFGNQITVRVPA
ncbi:MAG: hypothetical protein RL748_1344 [Pseudomonadota bacterium]